MRGLQMSTFVAAVTALTTMLCCCFLSSSAFLQSPSLIQYHNNVHSQSSASSRLYQSNNNNNNNQQRVDKGFNLLELASSIVPQGQIVKTAKQSWNFLWQRFMAELAPQDSSGGYQRPSYHFDNTIGSIQYPIEPQRYHLYLGNPCPWCHRVRLVINILQLEDVLDGVTTLVDDPVKASRGGWIFDSSRIESKPPKQAPYIQDLRQLYDYLQPNYTGRCTAPLLVDWKTKTIVSNESKNIVRMLPLLLQLKERKQQSTNDKNIETLTPTHLLDTIEENNEWIYQLLNNAVYRCGFSTSQTAYNKASTDVLQGLAKCQEIFARQNYICSNTEFTESDILLLPTMLRFDGVYSPFFRAGGSHLRLECDYPAIHEWLQRCWNTIDGVSASIDLTDACHSYYKQLFPLNPGGLLPLPVTPQSLHLVEKDKDVEDNTKKRKIHHQKLNI